MTPSDIISWSLAIGFSWILLSMCLPVERWIEILFQRRATSKALNQRLEELERRVQGKANEETIG